MFHLHAGSSQFAARCVFPMKKIAEWKKCVVCEIITTAPCVKKNAAFRNATYFSQEAFNYAAINARKLLIHMIPPLPVTVDRPNNLYSRVNFPV